jgi:opacity protein-like surface antigen
MPSKVHQKKKSANLNSVIQSLPGAFQMKTQRLFAPLLISLSCAALAAPLSQTSLLELQYDTNLVNSPSSNERLSSGKLKASHHIDAPFWQNNNAQLKTQWNGNVQVPIQYLDLITAEVGAALAGDWQPGIGFNRPWYGAALQSQVHWSDFTQRQWASLGVSLNRAQRLTDRIFLDAIVQTDWRFGREDAFRGFRTSLTFYENYDLTQRTALYATQSVGYGKLTTSYDGVLGGKSGHQSEELMSDYFLDEGLTDLFNEDWYTYGVEGTFADAMLGVNTRITAQLTLDIAYRFHLEFNDEVQYQRQMLYATLIVPWK